MSKALGGLVVARYMVEDMERFVDNRRERRAAHHAMRASRLRRWVRLDGRGARYEPVPSNEAPSVRDAGTIEGVRGLS